MRSDFEILFSVELLNEYFGKDAPWKNISFRPTPETERLLRDSGLLTRMVENKLFVLSPVINSVPVKLPDFHSRFSFYIQPSDFNFVNYTNVPLISRENCGVYFNNISENSVAGVNNISRLVGAYSASETYMPGDFAKGADGFTYECIKLNNGVEAPDDTVNDSKIYWVKVAKSEFAGSADQFINYNGNEFQLQFVSGNILLKSSVEKLTHIVNIYAYNSASESFNFLSRTSRINFDNPGNQLPVDFSGLESGLYRVEAGNDQLFVWYNSENKFRGLPFVLDIFHLPKSKPYSFLRNDGTLKNINYTIHFGARRVYWKYKTRTTTIVSITDKSGEITFKSDGLQTFISERPVPFSFNPRKTIEGNSATQVIATFLPSPDYSKLLAKKDDIFTTETFINY